MSTTNKRDDDAHNKLASMLEKYAGASVEADALRTFIKTHWQKVSALAHAVHEQN